MLNSDLLSWMTFLTASGFVLLLFVLLSTRPSRLDTRIRELSARGRTPATDPVANFAWHALPFIGIPLLPGNEKERTRLQTRLIHAGLYSRQAMAIFFGVKVCLMVGPALLGLLLGLLRVVPLEQALLCGALLGCLGMIAPSFWLDNRKTARQMSLRRALPDALDVMVICLEGGASLPLAIQRVASELRTAHPLLAFELTIVQREAQLGCSVGDALRQFADRADLDEVRSLASVILQAERYGASLVKVLRVHADTLRTKRLLLAEELAQKAVVKLLIPTILFILPAMFIVILGPTVMYALETFWNMK